MDSWRRSIAGLAALCGTVGGILVIIAVAGLPRPWDGGYVSEAGVASYPRAWIYRCGILGVSLGLLLLGAALPRARATVATLLLMAAGVLGSLSASVTCTAGCPLPPYDHTTVRDVVHASASSLAVGLATLAMAAIAWAGGPARRLARNGFAVTAPVLAALGICLLAIGRSTATAVLERLVLIEVLVWVIATSTVLAMIRGRPAPARSGDARAAGP